jgi:hypothetical protein
MVQFNIIASEYRIAWNVMERFEDLMISYAETIRGNGIIEYFMYKQYSDDFYDSFRNTFTVLNLVYRVDTETLRVIFKENINDIIANNKNLDRLDKIENPRPEHYPRPVMSCYTVREMDKVCRAIGCCWRAIMLERPEYSDAKANKIMSNMDLYRETSGMIIDHDDDRGLSDDE